MQQLRGGLPASARPPAVHRHVRPSGHRPSCEPRQAHQGSTHMRIGAYVAAVLAQAAEQHFKKVGCVETLQGKQEAASAQAGQAGCRSRRAWPGLSRESSSKEQSTLHSSNL